MEVHSESDEDKDIEDTSVGNPCLEPLSLKETSVPLKVSLRGSLAEQFLQYQLTDSNDDAESFIKSLIASHDNDLVKFVEGGGLVIGRLSEKGRYFPDW